MCCVSDISSSVPNFYAENCFCLSFGPSVCVLGGALLCVGVLLSHGNPENAFVTLNPCSVSADDIIVWEHITSPLPRLSLLKTALPGVYWDICTHVHTCKHAHKLHARLKMLYPCIWNFNASDRINQGNKNTSSHECRQIVDTCSNPMDQHFIIALSGT